MLKKIVSLFLFAIVISLIFTDCKKKEQPTKPLFSSSDTIQVNSMIEDYMNNLQSKNYEIAVNGLKEISGSSIIELSDEQKNDLINYYKSFPVIRYKLMDYVWNDRDLVRYNYSVEFFEKPEGEDIPNTYKISIVPVRIEGVWYLTIGRN